MPLVTMPTASRPEGRASDTGVIGVARKRERTEYKINVLILHASVVLSLSCCLSYLAGNLICRGRGGGLTGTILAQLTGDELNGPSQSVFHGGYFSFH